MDEDDEVVLFIAGHVCDNRLARLGKIAATAAEGAFFEDLPAVGGYQFVVGIEDDEIQIIAGGFKKDQVFAAIVVQVAGDNIIEAAILDRSFIAVQLSEFPDLALQGQIGY